MNDKTQIIPTGWKRVYAILSLTDGKCFQTDARLERCLLIKGHEGPCKFERGNGER